jgi:pilus assembly protein FimV
MIITCKACNARFNLDENLLKPTGSKVRCSKCNEVFMAYPPEIPEEIEEPIETAPEIEEQPDETAPDAEKKETADVDELDFSDMEKLLDEEKAPEEEGESDTGTEDLELDLDLDMSTEVETVKEGLEAEVEQEEVDELDLSGLEDLLDKEESTQEGVEEETADALKPEAEFVPEKAGELSPPKDDIEELDELDLSDLEEILDLEESTEEDESAPEDMELELDMDTEPELEEAPAGEEDEDLETVDLSEIEKMLEMEETEDQAEPEKAEAEEAEAEEKDLEFELEMEEAPAEPPSPDEDSEAVEVYELDEAEEAAEAPETVAAGKDESVKPEFEFEADAEEESVEDEIADMPPEVAEAATRPKKRVSKPLVFLLILVLLGGGSYGTYVLLDYLNIQIPYVSDYLKPKASDLKGNLKIDTLDINSKFILNVKAGKLFVITGRVKNGYSDNRSFINVTGKLFTKGKKLVKTENVFCGNVLSDIELSNMDFAAIQKRLANRYGDNRSNFQVQPGKELPFMIVFSNLPDNLEEFAIEAAGSTPATTSG